MLQQKLPWTRRRQWVIRVLRESRELIARNYFWDDMFRNLDMRHFQPMQILLFSHQHESIISVMVDLSVPIFERILSQFIEKITILRVFTANCSIFDRLESIDLCGENVYLLIWNYFFIDTEPIKHTIQATIDIMPNFHTQNWHFQLLS